MIDNETGNDFPLEDIGFPMAKDYTDELGMIQDLQSLQNLPITNMEGLVVVYENGIRIKIKFRWFEEIHKVLSQIIKYNKMQYGLHKKLKTALNLPNNDLSNYRVWDLLNEGSSLEYILSKVHHYHFYTGAGEWVKNICKDYKDKENKLLTENPNITKNELKSKMIPDRLEKYEISVEWLKPSSELVIWENIKRISEGFD